MSFSWSRKNFSRYWPLSGWKDLEEDRPEEDELTPLSMVPEEDRIADVRPLSSPFADPLRPGRELVLADRLEAGELPSDRWPVDLLPGVACFLVVLLFDLCPLLRRAVAVCFMIDDVFNIF